MGGLETAGGEGGLKHLDPLEHLPSKPLKPLSLAIILAAAISFAMVSRSALTIRKQAVQFD